MIRSVLAAVVFGAVVLAPSSFAQDPDLEGLPTMGMESPKGEPGDLVLRLGFTFASSVIPETIRHRLDRVVDILANVRPNGEVEVSGHTDSLGPSEFNQILSEKRAASVKAYLVEHGIPADRVNVVGYGESEPRESNDTIEGRRRNRRVELRITG